MSYYATQTSGACLADLPDPLKVSPIPDGGVDIWYKAPDVDWTVGYCIKQLPTPNGAATYDSELECCKGAYAGQLSGKCLSMLPKRVFIEAQRPSSSHPTRDSKTYINHEQRPRLPSHLDQYATQQLPNKVEQIHQASDRLGFSHESAY
jgi:hypothetical protein